MFNFWKSISRRNRQSLKWAALLAAVVIGLLLRSEYLLLSKLEAGGSVHGMGVSRKQHQRRFSAGQTLQRCNPLTTEHLEKLEILNLRSCALPSVGTKSFPWERMKHLKVIDISDNTLTSLPEDFCSARALRHLFLGHNQFAQVPAVLHSCTDLEVLGLQNNLLHKIESGVLPPNLRQLLLSSNQLTQLLPWLPEATLLRRLTLSNNSLSELPPDISQLTALEYLRLAGNGLTAQALPRGLFRMPMLSSLNLANLNAPPADPGGLPAPFERVAAADVAIGARIAGEKEAKLPLVHPLSHTKFG
jgi:Leucine-rich repeat (LRR) protein